MIQPHWLLGRSGLDPALPCGIPWDGWFQGVYKGVQCRLRFDTRYNSTVSIVFWHAAWRQACADEVFYFEKMEVNDFRNDVLLAEACRPDVDRFCKHVEPGQAPRPLPALPA